MPLKNKFIYTHALDPTGLTWWRSGIAHIIQEKSLIVRGVEGAMTPQLGSKL